LLSEIAVPVLVIATQSADVERVCKVHKLIHNKIRNRPANDSVYMLLYFYVNLRILKRLDMIAVEDTASHLEGFLAEALDDDHDSAEDDAGDGGLESED
jgi:hypothetical protein